FQQPGDAQAAAPGRPGAVLHSDVVVGDDRRDIHAGLGGGELGGHVEVHDVAGVVLHDVQDPGATVDGLGRRQHLVRDGRGEHLAAAGGVQHAEPNQPGVHRLVPGTATGDQTDLAGTWRVAAVDDLVLVVDPQLRVRGVNAEQRLGDDMGWVVDELLHVSAPQVRGRRLCWGRAGRPECATRR